MMIYQINNAIRSLRMYLITTLCVLSSVSSFAYFQDINTTHPHFQAIQFLQRNNIVEGYQISPDTRIFKSTQAVTRAEALKMLLLTNKNNIINQSNIYPDVKQNDWFNQYITTATQNGIVNGFQDGNFYPNAQVTQAEMLKMSLITFGALQKKDPAETTQWFEPYINEAKNLRIIDTPDPQKPLTRGEVAEIMFRTHHTKQNQFKTPYIYSGSGKASYYGDGFHGRSTANGETYDKNALTAAHRTLPFGTRIKVWIGDQKDKFVIVRINDRGPYHKTRVLDLSEKAFSELAPIGQGVLEVNFEVYSEERATKNIEIPEEIIGKLSIENQSKLVPIEVAEALKKKTGVSYITQETPANVDKKTPMLEGSIGHIGTTFFEDVRLYNTIPQKVRNGEVLIISGQTKKDNHQKITLFFQPENREQSTTKYSKAITGRHFFFSIPFLTNGKYNIGISLDGRKDVKMAPFEVLASTAKRVFPKSKKTFSNQLFIQSFPEKETVTIRWNQQDKNTLHKLEINNATQNQGLKDIFIPSAVNFVELPYRFFQSFSTVNDKITIDLLAAESANGTFTTQQSNWEKSAYKNLITTTFSPSIDSKKIEFKNFKRFANDTKEIILNGIKNTPLRIQSVAYIKTPNQTIENVGIIFNNSKEFTIQFTPNQWGEHILEIKEENGATLFRNSFYISKNELLPVSVRRKIRPTNVVINTAQDLVTWINRTRNNKLTTDSVLQNIAQKHAQHLAEKNFLSHTTDTGVSFETRLQLKNISLPAAENIARGNNFNDILSEINQSPEHLYNVNNEQWQKVGIGIAKNQNQIFMVQVFR